MSNRVRTCCDEDDRTRETSRISILVKNKIKGRKVNVKVAWMETSVRGRKEGARAKMADIRSGI